MKIAFLYAGGREMRWDSARAGLTPSDFFYGAVELARGDHKVVCIDAPGEPDRPLSRLVHATFGWRLPVRVRGEHLVATRPRLSRLREADVVVAASSALANAAAVWQALGFLPRPIVGIHCGHVNFPPQGRRREATRRAMNRQQVVLFADSERPATLDACGVDPERVHANSYGVDTSFWTPGPGAAEDRPYLLAVGNDGRRDYATLVAAAASLDTHLRLLTTRPLPSLPPHIENLRGSWHKPALDDAELRDLYRGALAVIVPLEDSIQPSGQSVALQAMACGRPVILTRTRGLWTGNDFADGSELLLVPPGDANALRAALTRLIADAPFRESLAARGREATLRAGWIQDFATRLESVILSAAS